MPLDTPHPFALVCFVPSPAVAWRPASFSPTCHVLAGLATVLLDPEALPALATFPPANGRFDYFSCVVGSPLWQQRTCGRQSWWRCCSVRAHSRSRRRRRSLTVRWPLLLSRGRSFCDFPCPGDASRGFFSPAPPPPSPALSQLDRTATRASRAKRAWSALTARVARAATVARTELTALMASRVTSAPSAPTARMA